MFFLATADDLRGDRSAHIRVEIRVSSRVLEDETTLAFPEL